MRLSILLFAASFLGSSVYCGVNGWTDGEVEQTVEVRVVDGSAAKPITGARVWLLTYRDRIEYEWWKRDPEKYARDNGPIERLGSRVATNLEGVVKVWTKFRAAWHDNPDGSTRMNRAFDGVVIVEARGYRRFESTLEPLIPKDRSEDLAITIELKRTGEPEVK